MYKHLKDLLKEVKQNFSPTLAVAAGQDEETIQAVYRAREENVCKVTLVGNKDEIQKVSQKNSIDLSSFTIIDQKDTTQAVEEAVKLVREGKADFIMKGLVKTSTYMKKILDRNYGLLSREGLLTHVAVMEIPSYSKLLLISDAAVIPKPTMEQKLKIIQYATEIAYALGNKKPKVALISAVETISIKVKSTVDAAVITAMNRREQIKNVIIDGPLALDVALSKEHCRIKGLDSPVNGEADILIFPNIETANTFYKSTVLLAKATAAAVVVGTTAPVILPSRADDDDTKFYSIVLATRLANQKIYHS
ncbi:MAG: bifunctional enoyl-CoA hydratase/phosphate acetyltransferase [bacterium]